MHRTLTAEEEASAAQIKNSLLKARKIWFSPFPWGWIPSCARPIKDDNMRDPACPALPCAATKTLETETETQSRIELRGQSSFQPPSMATAPQAVTTLPSATAAANKRKKPPKGKGKGNPSNNKKLKLSEEPVRRRHKPSNKFLKLLQKRARDYNSDDADDVDDDDEGLSEEASSSGDESGGGVTRFEQGCRAFRVAFLKIMAKKLPDDPLGPILSAHKKLVAAKLAEEAEEHKPKGEARKEKRMAAEKGHVIPTKHLDDEEKKLIKVATQGVVRLFNAVSKAQNPRKGLNPSRSKYAKALAKERKQTFLAELQKTSNQGQKGQASSSFSKHIGKDEDEPGWAPLRDTYMLGSKLKDWDKIQDSDVANKQTEAPLDDSSDEE